MKAKRLSMLFVCGVVAACGEGRAIFNVDVYSFLKGTGSETIAYAVPPLTSGTASAPAQKISLPGAGSSVVDSVRAFGTIDLVNSSGAGTIGFQVYLAADAAGTNNPSALAIDVPAKAVSGTATTPDTIRADLSAAFDSLFTKSELWIRLVATGTNPNATLLQGNAVLKSLLLTVIIKDKLF